MRKRYGRLPYRRTRYARKCLVWITPESWRFDMVRVEARAQSIADHIDQQALLSYLRGKP